MNWEPHEGNQRRCREHEQVFPRTSTCSQCAPGKGAPLGAITPLSTDKDLDLAESELLSEAKYYSRIARKKCDGDVAQDVSVGLKAADVSLKFRRAYLELVRDRKGYEHDRWLVEQNRSLKGDGAS